MSDQPDKVLHDPMQAQHIQKYIQAYWPTTFYMRAVVLSQLNRDSDSTNKLKETTTLDEALDVLHTRYTTTCFHICHKPKIGVDFLHQKHVILH